MLLHPTLEKTRASAEKRTPATKDVEESSAQDEPRQRSGVFRGILFALPLAGLLWALILLAARALLRLL